MIYGAKKNQDSALYYGIKTGIWECANPVLSSNRAIANANIANIYTILGDEKGKGTDKCKAIYSKGIHYATAACWEMDSLGVKSQLTLTMYYQAKEMYGMIGDTNRENFYRNKYFELKNYLNPGSQNIQANPGQKTTINTTKPSQAAQVDDTTNESKEAFNKRWNKRLDDILRNNTKQGTVSDTDDDGRITTKKTVISNGVATITTYVNGVLEETQRIKLN
jgi:hypothetical protein